MTNRRALIGAIVAVILALAAHVAVRAGEGGKSPDDDVSKALDKYLTRLGPFGFSGGVLVALNGKILLEKGYGVANRAKRIPITTETVFSIGSNTKDFTLAAIMKLARDGKLSLDDSIARFFKETPDDKRAITVRHLTQHKAGLESDFGGDYEPVSRDEIIRRALGSKLLSEPGARSHYSNAGYSLLAAIIELVSGQSYEQYLSDNIIRPAGLSHTGYTLPQWNLDQVAHGYIDGEDRGTNLEKPHAADGPYWNLRGNGGIHSTIGEMYRFYNTLDPDTARALFPAGAQRVMLAGGDGIFNFVYFSQPKSNLVIIAATTDADFKAEALSVQLARIASAEAYSLPPEVAQLDDTRLAGVAGDYKLPGGETLTVIADRGRLIVTGPQQAVNVLAALGPDQQKRIEGLNARAALTIEAGAKGDYRPFHEAIGQMPFSEVQARQTRVWKERRERLGEFKRVVVLGSFPKASRGDVTLLRLEFERGNELIEYTWNDGAVAWIRRLERPKGLEFLPATVSEFVRFDVGSGSTTKLTFKFDEAGRVIGLKAGSNAGGLEALRR